jgi:hypothetical protein
LDERLQYVERECFHGTDSLTKYVVPLTLTERTMKRESLPEEAYDQVIGKRMASEQSKKYMDVLLNEASRLQ